DMGSCREVAHHTPGRRAARYCPSCPDDTESNPRPSAIEKSHTVTWVWVGDALRWTMPSGGGQEVQDRLFEHPRGNRVGVITCGDLHVVSATRLGDFLGSRRQYVLSARNGHQRWSGHRRVQAKGARGLSSRTIGQCLRVVSGKCGDCTKDVVEGGVSPSRVGQIGVVEGVTGTEPAKDDSA